MALVSGGRSMLNPNAPLFIPAAMQKVEDFSPEWWDLVTTSTWFRDYWLSQHQGEDIFVEEMVAFDGYDVVELLPDTIDLGVDEDILNMEAQFEEFLQSSEADHGSKGVKGGMAENGFDKELVKNLSLSKQRREPAKYWDKPAKHISPKYIPRFLRQPR